MDSNDELSSAVDGSSSRPQALDLAQMLTLVDSIAEPLLVTNGKDQILLLNDAAQRLLRTQCKVVSRAGVLLPFLDWSCSAAQLPDYLNIVMNTGETLCFSREITSATHRSEVYEFVYAPLLTPEGKVEGVIERARDITKKALMENRLDEQEERVHQLLHYDSLTNLPSRSLFSQRLNAAIDIAANSGAELGIICLDLDNFKKVNDSLGHDVGDMVLQQVAERLSNCVGVRDTIARLSGDDFFILLESLLDAEHAQVITQNILWELRKSFTVAGYKLYLSGSAGISLYPGDATDGQGLMRCADVAMNKTKRRGGNGVHFFTAEQDRNIHEYLVLETDLQVALVQRQLAVQYQPQYNLHSGELIGVEALMRWYHPERGFISPGEFIPIAEQSDIILKIGAWVLEEACWQNMAWQSAGIGPFTVAVNVSPRQFRHSDMLVQVQEILARTGMDPRLLELEITEGTIMDDVSSAIDTMHALRSMGIKLAVDDFGTGYSSLSYLRNFNITKLKIDRCFVETIEQEDGSAQIAHSIVDLAKNLKLGVIAEGVETHAQLDFLRRVGCEEAQGYLLSRPVYAHEIPACLSPQIIKT
ncbi:MAG: EAL domain-containing protein [Thermodesulfobacteriota bacterium]